MAQLHVVNAPDGVALEFIQDEASAAVDQPLGAIAAAMAFGSLVFLAMATAPIVLGALVEAGRLTNETLGRVAMLETLGIAAGSTFGPELLRRGHLRTKVVLACLALAGLNLACYGAADGLAIASLRSLCGLLEGCVLAAATLVLTYVRNPERMNGYFLGIANFAPTAASYALSSFAIARFGANVGFGCLAAAAFVGVVAALGVSSTNVPQALVAAEVRYRIRGPGVILALASVLLQNAGVGAGFTYIVQIANQNHVPGVVVGASMAGLQAAAVIGSLMVGWAAWRLNHVAMLALGCLLEAAVVLALGALHVPAVYLIACCIFGLCWNGLLPYSLKLLITLDPSRRLGLLNTPVSLAGLGMGPLIASFFVKSDNVAPAFFVAGLIFLVSAALYVVASRLTRGAGGPVAAD